MRKNGTGKFRRLYLAGLMLIGLTAAGSLAAAEAHFPYEPDWAIRPEGLTAIYGAPLDTAEAPTLAVYTYAVDIDGLAGTVMAIFSDDRLSSLDYNFPYHLANKAMGQDIYDRLRPLLTSLFVGEGEEKSKSRDEAQARINIWQDDRTFAVLAYISTMEEVNLRFMNLADEGNAPHIKYWRDRLEAGNERRQAGDEVPAAALSADTGEIFPFKIRWNMSPKEVTAAAWDPLDARTSPILTIYLYPLERDDLRGTFMCTYYGEAMKLASVDFQFPYRLQTPEKNAELYDQVKSAVDRYFVAGAIFETELKSGHKAAVWRDADTYAVLTQNDEQAEVSARFMDVDDPNNKGLIDYWEEKVAGGAKEGAQ